MQGHIYVLYALAALCLVGIMYLAVIWNQRFDVAERDCARKVKEAWENAPIVKDIEDTIMSLSICITPVHDADHCKGCMVEEDSDYECINELTRHACSLLRGYKEMLSNEQT